MQNIKSDLIFILFTFFAALLAFKFVIVMEIFAGIGVFSAWWFLHKRKWKELL